MCHNKHSHFALTDIVHSGYCGLAISICVWQHTVAKTEVLKQASWLPCRNTRQSLKVTLIINLKTKKCHFTHFVYMSHMRESNVNIMEALSNLLLSLDNKALH